MLPDGRQEAVIFGEVRQLDRSLLPSFPLVIFHGSRAYASGIAAIQQISTTNSKKKTNRHNRAKPKPVPLDQLAPVPIEFGESGLNPLTTFFQGLEMLESRPPVALGAVPSSPQSSPQPPMSLEYTPQAPPEPEVVHIIHFGDSHVASDYWAGVLREKLQARFGNAEPRICPSQAGRGPASGMRKPGLWTARAGEPMASGIRSRDGVVGLGGMSIESYRELSPASAAASFSQFQIFAATSPGSSCFSVQVDDADVPNLTSQVEQIVATVPPPAPNDQVPAP